jgi:biopolymer transport protein ExbB
MQALMDAFAAIGAFMDQGGPLMYWIAALTFVMWTLAFERVWYFKGNLKGDVQRSLDAGRRVKSASPGMHTEFVRL